MKRILSVLSVFTIFCFAGAVYAQNENLSTDAKTFTYEELYDNPYDINKLFIEFQPMYGEFFTTNVTIGWGIQAQYYMKNIADFQAQFRTPYARTFDLNRNAAHFNSTVDNDAGPYQYFELLGTYHIKDEEEDTETKFILYSKRYKGDKWAATVPLHTVIPTKQRRIYGARFGGMAYNTTLNYNQIMDEQGVTIYNEEGVAIDPDEKIYGNLSAVGFYIGGSMTIIKNVAVQPDKIYGTLVNDLIFTTYFDINFVPMVTIEDIYVNGETYSSATIQQNVLGVRAGLSGKFNRKFSWGYGAELGYRPGLKGTGFFALIKIAFPVFSTPLRYEVESFGK